jgi:hypothetical protein
VPSVVKINDSVYSSTPAPGTASVSSERRFSAPFPGDKELYIHELDVTQAASKFRPLELSTPDAPLFPKSYLVEETSPQIAGPGLYKWTRVYSRIPASRSEGESYSWSMPGIALEASYTAKPIDNALSSNLAGSLTKIVTTADHNLSVGHFVAVSFNATFGEFYQTITVYRTVRAVLTARAVNVDLVIANQTPYFLSLVRVDGGRDPIQRVVPSVITFDYFLPGLTGQVKEFQAIPIFHPTYIREGGKEVNIYSTASIPTKAQYLADVAANNYVVAEPSVVKRWKGQIFERQTRYVRAQ